ncbi:MAG: DUF5658 family protein [Pyrinomonadaceae bacterium]|nr:DUF5658 family protein [Pyrinomonadaceae bacterium]
MKMVYWSCLLFTLNFLDAVLTVYWVRNGHATEGNHLMATLLELGDIPFLAVKLLIGAAAAIVLSRWGNLRLAQFGLSIALGIYIGLMGIHFVTGLSAFGYLSDSLIRPLAKLSFNSPSFKVVNS